MRLIDADAFGNRLYHEVFEKDSEDQRWDSGCWVRYKLFEKVLKEQPTVEQLEIVRCKDCKHNQLPATSGNANCEIFYGMTNQDGFCHMAERRTDDQT